MNTITDRILTQLRDPILISKLSALPKSDFYSLLLEIFRKQSDDTAPVDRLRSYQTNRFGKEAIQTPVEFSKTSNDKLLIFTLEVGIIPLR